MAKLRGLVRAFVFGTILVLSLITLSGQASADSGVTWEGDGVGIPMPDGVTWDDE